MFARSLARSLPSVLSIYHSGSMIFSVDVVAVPTYLSDVLYVQRATVAAAGTFLLVAVNRNEITNTDN